MHAPGTYARLVIIYVQPTVHSKKPQHIEHIFIWHSYHQHERLISRVPLETMSSITSELTSYSPKSTHPFLALHSSSRDRMSVAWSLYYANCSSLPSDLVPVTAHIAWTNSTIAFFSSCRIYCHCSPFRVIPLKRTLDCNLLHTRRQKHQTESPAKPSQPHSIYANPPNRHSSGHLIPHAHGSFKCTSPNSHHHHHHPHHHRHPNDH